MLISNIPDIKFICPVKIFNRWLHFTDRFILKFAVKFLLKLTKRSTGICHAPKGAGRGMNQAVRKSATRIRLALLLAGFNNIILNEKLTLLCFKYILYRTK
jgi:hypothetical protein